MANRIRVLIVDDSLFIRTILSEMLSSDPEIEIVGTAKDGLEAVELVKKIKPDVVTMDLVMPRADGIQALEKIMDMKLGTSVLMLSAADRASADQIIRCLELGAFDFVLKPASTASTDILRHKWDIIMKIKAASETSAKRIHEIEQLWHLPKPPTPRRHAMHLGKIVAIGSSTGGPVALRYILSSLPADLPFPIVIAQHMPKAFTESFAERVGKKSELKIVEAREDDELRQGTVYIAPGEHHMRILAESGKLIVDLERGERLRGGRPSADLLFESVADAVRENAVGIILSGMGNDGARGIKRIKEVGGLTIAQDEETSLVWSMPKAAIRLGVIDRILPLQDIPEEIISFVGVGG